LISFCCVSNAAVPESSGASDSITTSDRLVSRIQIKRPGGPATWLDGWILAADGENGTRLLVEADGRWHVLTGGDIQKVQETGQPFVPLTLEQASAKLIADLPKGFRTTSTKHYVVAYNTSEAYAKWNASLYERFFRGFFTFWKRLGNEVYEPEFPLTAIVFEKRADYLRYAAAEDVKNAENMIGYYNQLSNRIATYDLTGIEGMIPNGRRVNTLELINTILQQPSAERSVATVVHEAVHQLSYNSGLQTRLADNPVSISEGLAMFFESPDLKSATGWGGIGKINSFNLVAFRNALATNKQFSIARLIQDDSAFHDPATVGTAYGESWALNYFLIKARSKEYAAYLAEQAKRPPLEPSDPKRRLSDFQRHFGNDTEKLNRDFLKFAANLKP
jgi:hypothetical protein